MTRVSSATALLNQVAREPSQLRYAPQWLWTIRRPNIRLSTPWLPYTVIDELDRHLSDSSRVFEFGGGASTEWFAQRAEQVVTVENDHSWYATLLTTMQRYPHVDLQHHDADHWDEYVAAVEAYPDEYFDVIVVDGRRRVRCVERAYRKVKPGGLLLLDDTDRSRYAPAFSILDGWEAHTHRGLTPTKRRLGVTTIWRRPS